MPFSVLTMMVRKHTHGVDAGAGVVRSLAWPYYIGYVAFGIAATCLLLAMWKCAPNVKLRMWFWLCRIFVVAQFIGLLQGMGILLRTA